MVEIYCSAGSDDNGNKNSITGSCFAAYYHNIRLFVSLLHVELVGFCLSGTKHRLRRLIEMNFKF